VKKAGRKPARKAKAAGQPIRPRVAVWKFSSCDGCQLSLLELEDELLALVGAVEIAFFPEASREYGKPPYDISLVEGSVTTPHEAEAIKEVRAHSKALIAIGACATAGGIQSLRNFADVREFTKIVYAHPEYIHTLDKATPISAHVKVDFELRGCPVSKWQLLELLNATLNGRRPNIPQYSLCIECKRRGNACVMVARDLPCLGPVVQAGCGALCPAYDRGCYSCFGPKETPNTFSLANWFAKMGMSEADIVRWFRTYNAGAEAFSVESEIHEKR